MVSFIMDSSRVSHSKNGTLKALRNFLVYTCSTVLIFQPFLTPAFAQQIITDGRTQTQLVTKGSFTGITTTTIQNGNAFNSFSRFNVDQGNTVNLYIPDAADRLVNIVGDERSDINGTLNSYRNGTIGGDVFFLNPHGIVVGSSGVINTGSLTLATPSSDFVESLINNKGAISQAAVEKMISGNVPLSADGAVRILGQVNALDALLIQSNTQQLTGTVRQGAAAAQAIFENVVNTEGLPDGVSAVAVSSDGTISLLGAGQTTPANTRKMIVTDTRSGTRTQTILTVHDGLVDITTDSIQGANAYNSFSIFDVFKDQTVNLIIPGSVSNLINIVQDKQSDIYGQLNALRDGEVAGNVFFLNPYGIVVGKSGVINAQSLTLAAPNFSTIDNLLQSAKAPDQNSAVALLTPAILQKKGAGIVNLQGYVNATTDLKLSGKYVDVSGAADAAGTILVYGVDDVVINGGTLKTSATHSGDVHITAGDDIAVYAGSLISTAGSAGTTTAGSISLHAGDDISVGVDATLVAVSAAEAGMSGDIELEATSRSSASVSLDGSRLQARDVTIKAAADAGDAAYSFLKDTKSTSAKIDIANSTIEAKRTLDVDANAKAVVDETTLNYDRLLQIASVQKARASVKVDASTLTSAGNLDVEANSTATARASDLFDSGVEPFALPYDVAVGVATSDASVSISGKSGLTSTGGDVNLIADSRATVEAAATSQNLKITAGALGNPAAVAVSVGVLTNDANVEVEGSSIKADGNIGINAYAESSNETSINLVGDSATKAGIGLGVNYTNHNAHARVSDSALQAENGSITVETQSLQSSKTSGSVELDSGGASDSLFAMVDSVLEAVVENFMSEDGEPIDSGQKLLDSWETAESTIEEVNALKDSLRPAQEAASGKEDDSSTIFGAIGSVLVSLNSTSAEISGSADPDLILAGEPSVKAGGAVTVASHSNAFNNNTAATSLEIEDHSGTVTSGAVGVTYANTSNKAFIDGDDDPSDGVDETTSIKAKGDVTVAADQFDVDDKGTDDDSDDTIAFRGEDLKVAEHENAETLIATSTLSAEGSTGYSVSTGISVSTRDVSSYVDDVDLSLENASPDDPAGLHIRAQNELSSLLVEAGDASDMQELLEEAGHDQMMGALTDARRELDAAKAKATQERAAATTAEEQQAADKKLADIDAQTEKVEQAKAKVSSSEDSTPEPEEGAGSGKVADGGTAVTLGFALMNQNTDARLGGHTAVSSGVENTGALEVSASSAIQSGGLQTTAALNGTGSEAGTGTALNAGVALIMGETNASIDAAATGLGGLEFDDNVSVEATNQTVFTVNNQTATPYKADGAAFAGRLVPVSVALDMLSTTASLERDVTTLGDLSVAAITHNDVATVLAASTAGGEEASPTGDAVSGTLDTLKSILGVDDDEDADSGEVQPVPDDPDGYQLPDGEDEDEDEDSTHELAISAVLNMAFVANLFKQSEAVTKAAEDAEEAQQKAGDTMKEQGYRDYVLSAGVLYSDFDAKASIADDIDINAKGVKVAAHNDTDATVIVKATSNFTAGAGATVLSAALNLANIDNNASIGDGVTIAAGEDGVNVVADTASLDGDGNVVADSSAFNANSIGATAVGGSGNQTVISFALNLTDYENNATIGKDATIRSTGAAGAIPDIAVSSDAHINLTAEGNATNGTMGLFVEQGNGIDAIKQTYKSYSSSEKLALGIASDVSSPLASAFDTFLTNRESDEGDGGEGDAEDGNAQGFGAAFNLGLIDIAAKIGDDNTIFDVGDMRVTADAAVRSRANGVAGTGPSDPVLSMSGEADTAVRALDAAIGLNMVFADVNALVGTGKARSLSNGRTVDGTLDVSSLKIAASTQAMAEAKSDGESAGSEGAFGMSGAVNVHHFDTTAKLSNSVRASGDVSVTADADTVENVDVTASARGTAVEALANKAKIGLDGLLTRSGPSSEKVNTGLLGSAQKEYEEKSAAAKQASEKAGDAKQTQSIAAALGFNFADHDTKAEIADNVTVAANGDIKVASSHDAMSRTTVSGAAVMSDKGTGAAISGNVFLSNVRTNIGDNVKLGTASALAGDVSVTAASRFNTGVNVDNLLTPADDDNEAEELPLFSYSAEAIAGAGSKNSSLTGAIATTIYDGDTDISIGNNASVSNRGDIEIGSYDRSMIANRALGVSAALGTGTGASSARGAVGSVIYRARSVETRIGNAINLLSDGDANIVARVLSPEDAWVFDTASDSPIADTSWTDIVDPMLAGDFTAPLKEHGYAVTQSLHNEVVAAAAAGKSDAASFSGALGVTIATGSTKVDIGDHASISANEVTIASSMNQTMLGIGGSATFTGVGAGGAFGAQGAVNVVLDDVSTTIGSNGSITATSGDVDFDSAADMDAMTITAVASLSGSSGSNVSLNISSNTLEGKAHTEIGDNSQILAAQNASITAHNNVNAFAFAGALGVSFGGSNPIAGTLVSNVQKSEAQSLIGSNVDVTATNGDIDFTAATDERLLSIPAAGGGLAGVLSVSVVESTTRAVADGSSSLTASNGDITASADNKSDILEVAGSVGASLAGNAMGLTLPGSGISKTVESQIGSASGRNVSVGATSDNDIRQLAAAGAVSSRTGLSGAVGVLVLDNSVSAHIADDAVVTAEGNVWVNATDTSALLQFGGGVGAGANSGAGGAVGTLVVEGTTRATIGANAVVTAYGNGDESISVTNPAPLQDASEADRAGIVESINGLEDTARNMASSLKAAFGTLGGIADSRGARDALLSGPTETRNVKGVVVSAETRHQAVELSLALGAGKTAGIGGVVDVGVFNSNTQATVGAGARINSGLTSATQDQYGASQDVVVQALSTSRLIGFGGGLGAAGTAGVGGGATVNVFKGTTNASIGAGAEVKARNDVAVNAYRDLDQGVVNFALGAGGTAGVGAAVNISVTGGSTSARIDGDVAAGNDVTISASEKSDNMDIVGTFGGAGTAGVGGAVNVVVAKSTTSATLGSSGSINAHGTTDIDARAVSTLQNMVVAGGAGGVVGVGGSFNVVDSRRGVSAAANGRINQAAGYQAGEVGQNVFVNADSSVDMYRLVGGLAGGGTAGVGVSFDMATILNQTDASIGENAQVYAGNDVDVTATSGKSYSSNVIAGGAGGIAGVSGAIVINRTGSGNLNDYEDSDGNSAVDGNAMASQVDALLGTVMSGLQTDDTDSSLLNETIAKANSAVANTMSADETSVSSMLGGNSHDRTLATIGDGAVVVAGGDADVTATDYDRAYQLAGSIGAGGVAGVGITVGVNDMSSAAIAAIGNNAAVTVGGDLTVNAENVAVLEAVNFAGAAGGAVGVGGSVNYSRLTSTADTSIGQNAALEAAKMSVKAINEQDLAGSTIGIGVGAVGAGLSYTYAKTTGGATVTFGDGASLTTLSGALDVAANQTARLSIDGLAGAGGAVAGQAAVSQVREDSDATVDAGKNVRMASTDTLNVAAENDAWTSSTVLGVAIGGIAAGYVQSDAKSSGDADVTFGNGLALSGRTVDVNAAIGEVGDVGRLEGAATLDTIAAGNKSVQKALQYIGLSRSTYRRADAFGLAAAGAGTAALQGSNILAETGNDADVKIGSGQITSSDGSTTITTGNTAEVRTKVIGFTAGGLLSAGVHVARSTNKNNSRIREAAAISSTDLIKINAASDTTTTADSFSLGVGTVSVGASKANVTDHGATTVTLADATSVAAGDDIRAPNGIEVTTNHNHVFDARMDAFGAGAVGGGSGKTDYDIEATSTVDVGANRKLVAMTRENRANGENLTIHAESYLKKRYFDGDNIKLKNYGAISNAVINSDIEAEGKTGVSIANNARLYSGSKLDVSSLATIYGGDKAVAEAAGANAVAKVHSEFSYGALDGDKTSYVTFGSSDTVTAGELLTVSAMSNASIETEGEGHAYGGGGTSKVEVVTRADTRNDVSVGQNAVLTSYGKAYIGSGDRYVAATDTSQQEGTRKLGYLVNTTDVASRVTSIIGAAIGVPLKNVSKATSNQDNVLTVANGALVQSGGDLTLSATDDHYGGATASMDSRNLSITAVVSAMMSDTSEAHDNKSGDVTVNGNLATGYDRNRFISIASTPQGDDAGVENDWGGAVTGQGFGWQDAVSHNADGWSVGYDLPLGSVRIKTGTEEGGLHGDVKVATPLDGRLTILNDSADAMTITGVNVPDISAGKLYINGTRIGANGVTAAGVSYQSPAEDEMPKVALVNSNPAGPDLNVGSGAGINNLLGSVQLANIYGSVNVSGSVRAGELKILAGKDFNLDTPDADGNMGNEPATEYDAYTQEPDNEVDDDDAKDSEYHTSRHDDLTAAGDVGSIQAMGDVYINAKGVNINGLIQSGVSSRDTTITQADLDAALALEKAGNQKASYLGGNEDDRYYLINPVLDDMDPLALAAGVNDQKLADGLDSLTLGQIAEIPVYYDFATDQLVVKDMEAQGGTITIEGRIASTGRGNIQALDGFARFDITNETGKTLQLKDIDTGNGVEGTIIFNDHNYTSAQTGDGSYAVQAASSAGDDYVQTRWARLGDQIVKYQDGADQLVDGLATTEIARGASAASYDPLADQRYQWAVTYEYNSKHNWHNETQKNENNAKDRYEELKAQAGGSWSNLSFEDAASWYDQSDSNWKDIDDRFEGWGSDLDGLVTHVGKLILATGDDSTFRFDKKVVENGRVVTEIKTDNVKDKGIYTKQTGDIHFKQLYKATDTYSVRADQQINIGFFGESTGRINVTSAGDVVLGGQVRNISGQTNLTSSAGSILSAGTEQDPGVLIANQAVLTAAKGIGATVTDAVQIQQVGENASVNLSGPNVFVEGTNGSLRLGTIAVDQTLTDTGGRLGIVAEGDVDLRASNMSDTITAGDIHVESRNGRILMPHADGAGDATETINVDTDAANGGQLTLRSRDSGTTVINETDGDLILGEVDIKGDVSLNVNGNLSNGHDDTVDYSKKDATFAKFLDDNGYGTEENIATSSELSNEAKKAAVEQEYQHYWSMRGAGTDNVAAYDKNYVYQVSDEERATLTKNGFTNDQIAAYAEEQTAFYHQANKDLGEAAKAQYDPDFTYELSDAEKLANAKGLKFNRDAVLTAVGQDLYGGDAQNSNKSNNLKGRSLNVTVSGKIGTSGTEVTYNAAEDGQLSVEDMKKLRSAQVGDVILNDDGSVSYTSHEGVSINTAGTVTLRASDAVLESQGDLNVNRIDVDSTLQLKTTGSLINANEENGANVSGKALILSSAGEAFGTEGKRFVTETTPDGFVQLRTGGAAYVEEKTGDLRLQDASGPTLDLVANRGRIVSAFDDKKVELNGENIRLYGEVGIGEEGHSLDVTTRIGGSAEFQTPGDNYVYAPDQEITVKQAVVGGISKIESTSNIKVEKGVTFSAQSLNWYAPDNVIFGEGSTVVARTGEALIHAEGNVTMQSGSYLTAKTGAISITADLGFEMEADTHLESEVDGISILAKRGNATLGKNVTLKSKANGISIRSVTENVSVGSGSTLTAIDGAIDISAHGDVAMGTGSSLVSNTADITLDAGGDFDMQSGSSMNANKNAIGITTGGSTTLGSLKSDKGGADAISVTAGGSINGNGDGNTDIITTDDSAIVLLSAYDGIGGAETLKTDTRNLAFVNKDGGEIEGGDVSISNSRSLNLLDSSVGIGSNIDVTTKGDLDTNEVNAVDGDIDFAGEHDVMTHKGITTSYGAITVAAGNNLDIDALSDLTVRELGNIMLTADIGTVTQQKGSLIDSGLGVVRVHGGFDVHLRDVTSRNRSRYRIVANAGNYVDDGGNYHRNELKTETPEGVVGRDAAEPFAAPQVLLQDGPVVDIPVRFTNLVTVSQDYQVISAASLVGNGILLK